MAKVASRIGPVPLKPRRLPPFQSLVHAIIHQQLSGQAAGTILRRFQTLFGAGAFPSPAAVAQADPDSLRSAGLSTAKASYIKGLALLSIQGGVPSLAQCKSLNDAEIIAQLTAIKGVGRWTAEMFLIFNLGRPDVLPVHDLGVRRGFQRAFGKRQLPTPAYLERFGRRWAPYRTMAALYLWKTADFLKDDDW